MRKSFSSVQFFGAWTLLAVGCSAYDELTPEDPATQRSSLSQEDSSFALPEEAFAQARGMAIHTKSVSAKLRATHYAIKLWPQTEEELWTYEKATDLNVFHAPFDYVALPQEQAKTLKAQKTLPDERRYSVTHPAEMTTGGWVDERTIPLPVLYVAWPVDRPLPAGADYEVLYEAYHPQHAAKTMRKAALPEEASQILE